MSDLDRFELFTYVAQSGSLSQAASMLHVSKASLSKQIKHLETDLKVDLFSRSGYRLELTESGKALLTQCLRLKKELDDARSICQQFIDEPEGSLRIIVFEYFAKHLIFPKLNHFLQQHPKLELMINIAERIPEFHQEQIDLAVGFSLPAGPDIVRKRIMTTRYVLCASPSYFAKHGKPKNLQALHEHFYIGHTSRPEDRTINLRAPRNMILKPNLLLNNVSSMIECAKQGIGIIQLPFYLIDESLKNGTLIEILEENQAINVSVDYYYPKYRYIQPKVRKFIDFFLNEEGI